ncbi:MAG TPA: DUF362 domain-containing protein [Deltaproteobacteria bacterium]|nr:DUF362 domain-containing protein [Deltaproteobacteria bacterium]
MARSVVYLATVRTDVKRNLFDKLDALLERLDLRRRFRKGCLAAVKLHFGERGNTSYIAPTFVRRVVERIEETGARPFLTDTNTLYVGSRCDAATHLRTAIANGFDYAVAGAPIVIADGLRGEYKRDVEVDGRRLRRVSIAGAVADADAMAVLTHFKGHEISGFGGTLKNLGMGCASREGKLTQHSSCAPVVEPAGCTACGDCALHCPADAIDVGERAVIDEGRCIGCGHCIAVCPEGTIKVRWNEEAAAVQEKMVEYAAGALSGKEDRCVFLNFVTQVSPLCDCYGATDAPIVPDIGIAASLDPVAIDQASADLVNAAPGLADSALESGHEPGGDKFRGIHPDIDWTVQLRHAELMGLGSRDYELREI